MTINKRKKNTRQRGSKTHGWGSMKKHRGAGSRGGRGRAGSGKRADTKKTSLWNKGRYFGIRGIKQRKKRDKIINTLTIKSRLNTWLNNKKIEKKQDVYIINLNKLGYDKLLSKEIMNLKLDITVKKCSKKAIQKIEKAGGKVTIIEVKREEKKKEIKTEGKQEKKNKQEKKPKETKTEEEQVNKNKTEINQTKEKEQAKPKKESQSQEKIPKKEEKNKP